MQIDAYKAADAPQWLKLLNLTRTQPLSWGEFTTREKLWPKSDFRLRRVGRSNGEVLVAGQINRFPYASEKKASALLVTTPGQRRHGFGNAMLDHLAIDAKMSGYSALLCDLDEAKHDTIDWLFRRGFTQQARRLMSSLDLTSIDISAYQARIDDLASRGVQFVKPEDDLNTGWDKVLVFFRDRLAETPDMAGLPAWDIDHCAAVIRDSPNARPGWTMVAMREKSPVGIAVMHQLGTGPYLYFIGVSPSARGAGIATAMIAILADRAQREGHTTLAIDNLDSNVSALSVNRHLGFVVQGGRIELERLL